MDPGKMDQQKQAAVLQEYICFKRKCPHSEPQPSIYNRRQHPSVWLLQYFCLPTVGVHPAGSCALASLHIQSVLSWVTAHITSWKLSMVTMPVCHFRTNLCFPCRQHKGTYPLSSFSHKNYSPWQAVPFPKLFLLSLSKEYLITILPAV